jgi:acid phosphatase (class A)
MLKPQGLLLALAMLAGMGAQAGADQAAPVAVSRLAAGYLDPARLPDSVALVAAPPAEGSRALRRDRDGERRALALHGTPRWDLARSDADLFTPRATATFSCAAGFAIGPESTPRLNALLRRTAADFGMVSAGAKAKYQRARPFVGNGQPVCTPEQEGVLRGNGSYPSGHSTIGYGWALVLADLLPQRRRTLLDRGRAFGDSRRVCNVHFRSDVEAGQALAAPVFARLRQDAAFRADLDAAKAELRSLARIKPDCADERAALRLK